MRLATHREPLRDLQSTNESLVLGLMGTSAIRVSGGDTGARKRALPRDARAGGCGPSAYRLGASRPRSIYNPPLEILPHGARKFHSTRTPPATKRCSVGCDSRTPLATSAMVVAASAPTPIAVHVAHAGHGP